MNFLPQGETVLQHDMVSDSHTFAGTERLRKWDTMRMWHDSFLRGAPTSGVGKRQRGLPQGSTGRKGPAARVRSCGELSPAPGGGQAGRREEPITDIRFPRSECRRSERTRPMAAVRGDARCCGAASAAPVVQRRCRTSREAWARSQDLTSQHGALRTASTSVCPQIAVASPSPGVSSFSSNPLLAANARSSARVRTQWLIASICEAIRSASGAAW